MFKKNESRLEGSLKGCNIADLLEMALRRQSAPPHYGHVANSSEAILGQSLMFHLSFVSTLRFVVIWQFPRAMITRSSGLNPPIHELPRDSGCAMNGR